MKDLAKMKIISKSTGLVAAIVSLACMGSANANTITAVVGGSAESGATYVNFDSLSGGQTASYNSGALTVLFNPNAQTEFGSGVTSVNNGAAQPILSGNNNVNFGSAYTGSDNTTYLAAGNNVNNGSLTFNFTTAQNYLGLLWGSVDAGNLLTFYSGANGSGSVVATVTGANLNTINPVVAQTGFGDTFDAWGTAYVNINTTSGFQSVVATTTTFTFEVDNVAYGNVAGVPDVTSSFILLLVGLGSLALFAKSWNQQPVCVKSH